MNCCQHHTQTTCTIAGLLSVAFLLLVGVITRAEADPAALVTVLPPSASSSVDSKAAAPTPITVSVVGSVLRPGTYTVKSGSTVFDAVIMAGGLATYADPRNMYVKPANNPTGRIPLDWVDIPTGPADPAMNPIVHDGDKIIVPEIEVQTRISITGEVCHPGMYNVSGSIRLINVIAIAGGVTDRANIKDCRITWLDDDSRQGHTSHFDLNSAGTGMWNAQSIENIEVPKFSRHNSTATTFAMLGALAVLVSMRH